MIEKPDWKLEAERVGESLPEYWTLSELSKLYGLANVSYLSRLAKANRFPTYKIGHATFVRHEQIQMVRDILKR